MDLLSLEQFIVYLEPLAGRDVLAPGEASRLQLTITELMVDNYASFDLLKFLCRFLTQQAYDEIIEERNIEHQCGYLICDKSPTQQVRRHSSVGAAAAAAASAALAASASEASRFQIYNRKPSMILPNTYLSQYCCKDHYQASIFYRNQLSNESVFARKDILTVPPFCPTRPNFYENSITCLEEVLARHRELKEQGKSISEVISMMSGLRVGSDVDTSELAQLIEDFDIVEKEHPLIDEAEEEEKSAGYITSDKSFGGYVV